MANLRIIYDNAADRASLSASTSSGALVAENMYTDIKSDIWRSIGTTVTLTATWAANEMIGGIVLAYCNLTPNSTVRVRVFSNVGDASPAFDSGYVAPCAGAPLGLWGWGAVPLGVNAFAYAGAAYGRVWLSTPTVGKKVVMDIVDTTNPSGYIEVGKLIAGAYWSPVINAAMGASLTVADSTKQFRTDAGDLLSDNGTRHRKQSLTLPPMESADRAVIMNILVGNGLARPLFFSLYPDAADPMLEQAHQMYCKLVATPQMSTPYFGKYTNSLDIEEV